MGREGSTIIIQERAREQKSQLPKLRVNVWNGRPCRVCGVAAGGRRGRNTGIWLALKSIHLDTIIPRLIYHMDNCSVPLCSAARGHPCAVIGTIVH